MLCSIAFPKDFGVEGNVYPIDERDMREFLAEKTHEPYVWRKFRDSLYLSTKSLETGPNLPHCTSPREHLHDPTYIVEKDITDSKGNLLFLKGQKVNPLQKGNLIRGLIFLDGTDANHIQWALNFPPEEFNWILVKGDPFSLEDRFERTVYFDQDSKITTKLDIQSVPAKVAQQGLHLLIKETPLKPGRMCNGYTNRK